MSAPSNAPRCAEILLVEDNDNDVFLTQEAFKNTSVPISLHMVDNGKECLAFLRKEGRYAQMPTPDLILLDLNMPVMDGREALSEIIADPRLKPLPVVILTTSAYDRDIRQMYELRCSSYIVKPLDYDAFEQAVHLVVEYWFKLSRLPTWDKDGR